MAERYGFLRQEITKKYGCYKILKRFQRFLLNAAILTGTSLFMRTITVSFHVYVSSKIGAAGMGLFSLIMSVYTFAVTFATSGISLATTRLCAEYIAREDYNGAKRSIRVCCIYSIVFGISALFILFFGADFIGCEWLGDQRTVSSIRLLALSLPFISLSSVLSGYFSAVRRVIKTAVAGLFEQFLKISLTVAGLLILAPRGLEYACLALVGGSSIAEGGSFFVAWILYRLDRRRHMAGAPLKGQGALMSDVFRRMLSIAFPVALSAYVRSGLVTLEHILIPRGLKKSGASAERALAAYGTIHGMVFPVILFPSALLGAVSGLVVPELTEMSTKKEMAGIERTVSRALQMTLLFAIGSAGAMSCFSSEIGLCLYKSHEAGEYIKVFCSLIPVMYLDGIVDGMLKGLGQQMASMRYNIIDSAVSVILVYVLLPRMGIDGYLITVFVTELLNGALSLWRLLRVCPIRLRVWQWIVKPILCTVCASKLCYWLFSAFPISFSFVYGNLIFHIACFIVFYINLASLSGTFRWRSLWQFFGFRAKKRVGQLSR